MRRSLGWLLVLCLCVAVTLPLAAQKFTGSIAGVVTDPAGAVVPDADVTITNSGTGDTRNVKTNASGEYAANDLNPGTYSVTVKSPNFKEYVAKGVQLFVSSTATVNAMLTVGSTTEVMTVEANNVQVETTTGAVGNVVEGKEVRELPLNGRSFAQLTQLMPGVSPANNFDSKNKGLLSGVDFSVNGNNTTGNIFMVDGVNNNDIGSNRTILIYPSIDAIQEFKMLRNSYGPEYGQAMGAIINIVTRSGTNQFHGGAFYFGRNDALNATDYFNGLNGLPKSELRRNDFGYNIGGPIIKDKLFFFWSQEWNREKRGVVRTAEVPTTAEQSGDFSAAFNANNPSGSCDPSPGVAKVPKFSPAGQLYLSMFPAPNVANPQHCQNWAEAPAAPIYWREENIRVDYKLGKTWSLFGRYTYDHWDQGFPSTLGFWGDDQFPSIESTWKQPGYQATVKLTKLLGTSSVNDFQFSWAGNKINVGRGGLNSGLNDQIVAAAPTYYPLSDKLMGSKIGYPGFWGGCGADCATGSNLWTQGPWHNNEQLFIIKDDFSKVMGNHTFKVGFLGSQNQKNEIVNNESQENAFYWGPQANGTNNGAFNILNAATVWGGGENQHNPFSQARWHDIEFYYGDNWKIRRNITFEYGFRWSFLRNPYSGPSLIANFEPSAYNPNLMKNGVLDVGDPCNGMVVVPGTHQCAAAGFVGGTTFGPNNSLRPQNNHAIAPRIGLAWDPKGDGKEVFRAGFGEFYQRERVTNTENMATNPPFALAAGYNRTLDTPPAPGTLSASGTPQWNLDTRDRLPRTWQWNLTFERELYTNSKLELAYVGNHGANILQYSDANRVPDANRFAYASGSGDNHLRPFGGGPWGVINQAYWGGDSNYHALQALYRTKMKSLDAQFAYTWSKSLSDTDIANSGGANQYSLLLDPKDPHLSYGPTSINRPHIFTSNIVYDVTPMTGHSALVRGVLGGWELGSILSFATGSSTTTFTLNNLQYLPAAITEPNGTVPAFGGGGGLAGTGSGQNNLRPNLVPGQGCRPGPGAVKYQWLNPARYTMDGFVIGTSGNANTAALGDCLGPGIANVDFSFYKNFKLTERVGLQFRLEFYNLFNTTQFLGNSSGATDLNNTLNNGGTARNYTTTQNSNGTTTYTPCASGVTTICGYDLFNQYGQAFKDRGPREIQYALKLTF